MRKVASSSLAPLTHDVPPHSASATNAREGQPTIGIRQGVELRSRALDPKIRGEEWQPLPGAAARWTRVDDCAGFTAGSEQDLLGTPRVANRQ